jgi:hypothetical protein
MRALTVVVLAFAGAACGAASPLGTDGGAGGAGSGAGGGGGSAGAGSGGSTGAGGSTGTGGAAGATGVGGSGGAGGTGGAGGSSQCPPNQIWCPGCTPGTGACYAGGCPGVACPPPDAGAFDSGGGACSAATTVDECDALPGCHPVFIDMHNCRCAQLGCCARFSRCADGDQALCKNTGLSCTLAQPYCEGPYVVGYANGCYEGCVRMTECAP